MSRRLSAMGLMIYPFFLFIILSIEVVDGLQDFDYKFSRG